MEAAIIAEIEREKIRRLATHGNDEKEKGQEVDTPEEEVDIISVGLSFLLRTLGW